MKMKVLFCYTGNEIIALCRDDDLYTSGSCEEYEAMLSKARGNGLTADEVVEIAEDIAAHSTTDLTVTEIAEFLLNRARVVIV